MKTLFHKLKTAALLCCIAGCYQSALAEDIDIFTGASGGAAGAPNVMFLLDDSTDWSSNQSINTCAAGLCPTLSTSPAGLAYNSSKTTGGNELNAIIVALNSLYNVPTGTPKPNVGVGLASFTGNNPQATYVRFGARNIGDPSTGAAAYKALNTILSTINPVNNPTKVNVGKKDESEGMFELYRYFTNGAPGTALAVSDSTVADYPGNQGNSGAPVPAAGAANDTAYNLAACGNATTPASCLYRGPSTACSKNFIIYIVNHDHSNSGLAGSTTIGGVNSIVSPDTAVPRPSVTISGTTYQGDVRAIYQWANFLYKYNNITLYVVDVGGNASSTDSYSIALQTAATLGGGKYFAVPSSTVMSGVGSLANAITQIFVEIQAVNSTFASVSLPINATTRSQDLDQVFIPMFRPDPNASPLWMGNLKKYQLILSGNSIQLGDNSNPPIQAVNSLTGFATPCAQSFWTVDSGNYWQNVTENPPPKGTCANTSVWSDLPDGAFVEKGGVAEVIRRGNNPPTTATSPTWNVNRTIYTYDTAATGSIGTFSTSSTGLSTATGLSGTSLTNLVNFIKGQDVNSEYTTPPPPGVATTPAALTRPSLHGDTIHSQPLPVTYTNSSVYVYYGSNDGMLRAVNAQTGQEQWAFVAPEFYSRLNRLKTQSPLILYPNEPTSGVSPTPTKKDYFWDGSLGLYQNADNSKIWIYPSMRRGGRMLYGLDVTTAGAQPVFKWKVGCPNLYDDTGCVDTSSSWGASTVATMAQTWSIPNVAATVQGYSTGPVIVVGGGYNGGYNPGGTGADTSGYLCEDQDTSTPTCTTKGSTVNVIDANTGALIKSFSTTFGRSVAADVALLVTGTASPATAVDHAYAVDTGGNIYRIDFNAGGPNGSGSTGWVMSRVAYTNGAGRKFLFAPALFQNPNSGVVYVAIGSGDREHPLITQYPYTTPVLNRFYVYRDNLLATLPITATNLDSGTNVINVSSSQSCIGLATTSTTTEVNQNTIKPGSTSNVLALNLNQNGTGEQTVTSAVITGGMATFSTNRPIPAASGTCSSVLGEARGYFINLFNGSGAIGVGNATCGGSLSATFVGGGLPPSPVRADVNIGGTVYQVVIGAVQRNGGANSPIAPQQLSPVIQQNRNTKYVRIDSDR